MTHFSTPHELISIVVSVFIVALIALDGKCHWLEGAQLLAVYAIIALAFFFVVKTDSELKAGPIKRRLPRLANKRRAKRRE